MSGPEVITLGCRLNVAESEAMRALAGGEDDLVIVNSCAVTNEAVRQTRQAIRRAKRARPDARIVRHRLRGAGRAGDVRGDARGQPGARQSREVRFPLVPARAWRSPRLRHHGGARDGAAPRSPASPSGRGRSSRCRTAATIAAPSASSPMAAATAARCRPGWWSSGSRRWSDEGFSEVVLTGVDVTSYGPDLPGAPTSGQLIERILRHVPGAAAAPPLLARLHRDGRAAVRARRRRAALHAAPPYELPGRRRHGPEADEAAASAAPTRSRRSRG